MSNVVPFDTLEMAMALRQEDGFDQTQAEGTAKVLSRLLVADLVTKTDLVQTKNELKVDLGQFKNEFKSDLGQLRNEFKLDVSQLRNEFKADLAEVKADILKWLFGTILAQTGLIIAAFKLLH